MVTYNWKIQYADFYSDQFKNNGLVDKENAVKEFQFFPWDKQTDDYRRKAEDSCVPKIIFVSDDKRELIIDAINLKGFNIRYSNFVTNQRSHFYISNDFEKKNFTTEEIIEFFFDNKLEQHIKLKTTPAPPINHPTEEKEKKAPKNIEFNFKPNHLKTIGWLPFIWFSFSAGLYFLTRKSDFPIIMHVALALTWFPTVILHLTYIIKNNSAKVIIDTKNHDLTYIKGAKEIKFNRDDVFRCQITTAPNRASWNKYAYVWFILNDKTYVVITCFIADPFKIVETLNCKSESVDRTLPLLPL